MSQKLSPEMQRAYDMAKASGDVLLRFPGGFWAQKGWTEPARDAHGVKNYTTAHTVNALIARGAAIYSDHKRDRGGVEFAVAITIKAIQ